MNTGVNQLAGFIAGKDALEACTVQELQSIVARYPYLAAAQVLLCRKMNDETAAGNQQRQKTGLYLTNPLWLKKLLDEDPAENKLSDQPLITEPVRKEIAPVVETGFTEQIDTRTKEIEPVEDYTEEPGELVITAPEADEHLHVIPEETGVAETIIEQYEELIPDQQITEDDNTTVEEIIPAEIIGEEPDDTVMAEPEYTELPGLLPAATEDTATTIEEDEELIVPEPNEPLLKMPEFKIEPIDPAKATLSFEPYHTVDYFASQGIKIREEEKPRDRFSQQLKSFTEWIKVMKKIPPTEAGALSENLQEEKKVVQLAAHSIADQRVLTEAMAEVWEKQGSLDKAVEVYQKLSLLDPSKSAYFAAKIEHLKKPS